MPFVRCTVRQKTRHFLYTTVAISTALFLLVYLQRSSIRLSSVNVSKRNAEKPPNDDPNFEPVPGTLVCQRRPVVTARLQGAVLSKKNADSPLALVSGWKQQPGRNIGCCPAGARDGKAYREGYACCVNHIYNVTASFCCLQKERALENNAENIAYCYPLNRPPYCRERDLKVIAPLKLACEYTKYKTPYSCEFLCPPGSFVMGQKSATCSNIGNWSNQPKCCEGCPSATFKDIWFVVDVDSRKGQPGLSDMRSFLKGLITYLPVSQERTRIALTAFHSKVLLNDQSWTLAKYDNHREVNNAINQLVIGGTGRNIGQALTWVMNEGLTARNGDRRQGENVIVLITAGNPDDVVITAAEQARRISRFIVITVGPDATSQVFSQIPTRPAQDNFLRVNQFVDLHNHRRFLYTALCGEGCAVR